MLAVDQKSEITVFHGGTNADLQPTFIAVKCLSPKIQHDTEQTICYFNVLDGCGPDGDTLNADIKEFKIKIITRGAVIRLAVLTGFIVITVIWGYFTMIRMPAKSYHGPLPPLTEAQSALKDELRADVQTLAGKIGERNIWYYQSLTAAAEFIEDSLTSAGYNVRKQQFEVQGRTCCNIEAQLIGTKYPDENDKLDNAIREAQEIRLKNFLGDSLYLAFINNITDGSIYQDLWEGVQYKDSSDEDVQFYGVKELLIWLTLSVYFKPEIKDNGSGFAFSKNENSESNIEEQRRTEE